MALLEEGYFGHVDVNPKNEEVNTYIDVHFV